MGAWEPYFPTRLLGSTERYESLDGLDVSIDGVDILILLNSLDTFAESTLVLLSLLQL